MVSKMNNIVLDLEWNQTVDEGINAILGEKFTGEIIQIGAVKLNERMQILESLKMNIKPVYIKKLRRRISELTGINDSDLESGIPFKQAVKKLKKWCGKNARIITWGSDDIRVMKQNLKLHSLDGKIAGNYLDLQRVFSYKTGDSSPRALDFAAKQLGIEEDMPFHDALNDAYYTARVCKKLRLPGALGDYEKVLLSIDRQRLDEFADKYSSKLKTIKYYDFQNKRFLFKRISQNGFKCPLCKKRVSLNNWRSAKEGVYLAVAGCQNRKCGHKYFIKLKIIRNIKGKYDACSVIFTASEKRLKQFEQAGDVSGSGSK